MPCAWIARTFERLMPSTFYFQHFILHHVSTSSCGVGLAQAPCQHYEVRYPVGFKTTKSSSTCNLGVFLSSDLKFHIHCSAIAAKAHHRCALLLKGFHSNDVSILLQLFTTYVRPLLESNTQVWNPWLHQDIHSIEKDQRFFTRAVCRRAKLSYMDYGTRLRNLNLQSLEYRRVFFDLVMCYKIVFHLVDVDVSDFFVINSHVHFTRVNHFKLKSRLLPHHNFRLNFFSERVIPIWNSLPNSVVSASSVCAFKAHLRHVDLTPFCKLFPYK